MDRHGAKLSSKKRVTRDFSPDALYGLVRAELERIPEHAKGKVDVVMADALMTGFSVFALKDQSLLAFDERRRNAHNLGTVFGITKVLCDSQLRTRLDAVSPVLLRPTFHALIGKFQSSGLMAPFEFLNGYYLLALDGTGTFSSDCIHSEECLTKTDKKTGKKTYYPKMLQAAFVHPDHKEVIPLPPEMIIKQDGSTKNDCEINASKRFFPIFRMMFPDIKVIVVEDGLYPNGPHLLELKKHDLRFIIGVKPGDHAFLFDYIKFAKAEGLTKEFELKDPRRPNVTHRFMYLNAVPINESHLDIAVNFMEYWQIEPSGIKKHFTWVTDIRITKKTAYPIMKGGRARWKIENETFNTLKNQGYNLEHNYGLGAKHLSAVFATLMVLAFLTDQLQQLCWPMFDEARAKYRTNKALREDIRRIFKSFHVDSARIIYEAIVYGIRVQKPEILYDTS